jgi:hypothetical protein
MPRKRRKSKKKKTTPVSVGDGNAFFIASVVVLSSIALYWRWSGLDPVSLWLDDEWVGITVRHMTFRDFFDLRPPVPLGFLAVEKLVATVFSDPEWSLQLFPLLCSLARVPLMAALVFAVTKRRGLALLAAALMAIAPSSVDLAVRVKQYSGDELAVIGLLFVGNPLLAGWDHRRAWSFALWAVIVAFFSFPSLFISVPLLHLAFVLHGLRSRGEHRFEKRHFVIMIGFNVAVALIWAALLRGQSSDAMKEYWSGFYLPTDLNGALAFLQDKGWKAVSRALPDALAPVLVLLPLGLVDLGLRPGQRGLVLLLLGFYLEMLCLSALQLYPLGGGRTDSFSHPIAVLLVLSGVNRLTMWLSNERAMTIVASGLSLVLVFGFGTVAKYPRSGDAPVIRAAHDLVKRRDALIIYPHATIAVGYYGTWPIRMIPWSDYAHNFHVLVTRPNTLNLSPRGKYWRNPSSIDRELAEFLAVPHHRIFYLEAARVHRRPRELIRLRLKEAGFKVGGALGGRTARLTLFTKRSP